MTLASDEDLRNAMVALAEGFRDNAPTTAAQAATIILDGVRAGEWRILVGDDAHRTRRGRPCRLRRRPTSRSSSSACGPRASSATSRWPSRADRRLTPARRARRRAPPHRAGPTRSARRRRAPPRPAARSTTRRRSRAGRAATSPGRRPRRRRSRTGAGPLDDRLDDAPLVLQRVGVDDAHVDLHGQHVHHGSTGSTTTTPARRRRPGHRGGSTPSGRGRHRRPTRATMRAALTA